MKNNRNTWKRKNTWKTVGKVAAVVLAVILLLMLVNSLFTPKKDDEFKTIHVNWTIGGLDESGNFDPDATGYLVSDPIEVNGDVLKFIPDFNSNFIYSGYLYNENMDCIDPLYIDEECHTAIYDEAANYIRIVLDPQDEDGKINWFEYLEYISQFEVQRKVVDEEPSTEGTEPSTEGTESTT